ncbi:MAG: hypothetical protein IPO81_10180 [Kouleothrix sp.]|nr:hypothetical protein [Kouleothrix sp.]
MLLYAGHGLGATSQDRPAFLRLVRLIELERVGAASPTGLAFAPVMNAFLMPQARDGARPSSLAMLSPLGRPTGSGNLAGLPADSLNITFDGASDSLLLLDSASGELVEVRARPAGGLDLSTPARFEGRGLGVRSPRGMAVDPSSGRLFVLDGAGPRLALVDPAPGGEAGAAALSAGEVSYVDLGGLRVPDLRGLALNPRNGHLYTLSPARQRLYEITGAGEPIAAYDLAAADVRLSDPRGMAMAPSGDQTDDPAELSLYVADGGLGAPQQPAGRLAELSLSAPPAPAGAPVVQPALLQTIDTSRWSPPSPDPMDITYLPSINRLLVSDSEVEEYTRPYWHGVNLFEATLAGKLVKTETTFIREPVSAIPNNFSYEPVGVAYDPASEHWFFSDDDKHKIIEVDLGQDDAYGTSDDLVTEFVSDSCGDQDPESLTVDTGRGHLILADGLNGEVYDVAPGPNGRFDGCASPGDDTSTHFDTTRLGILDPEGIEYNPDTGTLFITGHGATIIIETTIGGSLLRVYDVAALDALNLSGLAYAPSSADPTRKSLYISARGLDNDTVPKENDGKIYEISLEPAPATPTPTATPTRTPTVTPTRTATPTPEIEHVYLPLIREHD